MRNPREENTVAWNTTPHHESPTDSYIGSARVIVNFILAWGLSGFFVAIFYLSNW